MTESAGKNRIGEGQRRRLLLVIPVNETRYDEPLKEFVQPFLAPDFSLDVKSITQGSEHIASRWDLQINGSHIARLIYEIGDRYDGIFISDFDGAGLEASRELVRVPLIDGFLPQVVAALSLASTFSIIAPDDSLVSLDVGHPRAIGASQALASVRSIGMSLEEMSDPVNGQRLVERVYEESVKAIVADGALAIILGCTGMIGVAGQVGELLKNREVDGHRKPLDVPVTDPNICGVTYLQSLVRAGLAQCGLSYQFPSSLPPKA